MKDENAFNSHLSKELKRLERTGPDFTFYMKAADKFRSGVSDFLIWRKSLTIAVESKFTKTAGNGLLLSHPFSGPQLTFLESIALSGNEAYGLIGIGEEKAMYLVPYKRIPKEGNWQSKDFFESRFYSFSFGSVEPLLDHVFINRIARRTYGKE